MVGGKSEEETLKYFANCFLNSGARSQFLILNPYGKHTNITEYLMSAISYGKISILDIPCGAGASICSLLLNLYELRINNFLSNIPVNIDIIGADISTTALEIYEKFLSNIEKHLIKVGIRIKYETKLWDANCPVSTTQLMDIFLKSNIDLMVYISNFNSSLSVIGDSQILNQILPRLYNRKATILWIEPGMKRAKRIFKNVIAFIKQKLMDILSVDEELIEEGYSFYHFIQEKKIDSNLIIKKIDRYYG